MDNLLKAHSETVMTFLRIVISLYLFV